eukprot:scaffold719_cov117-Cylindrotheca_fusiformis.AAC.11
MEGNAINQERERTSNLKPVGGEFPTSRPISGNGKIENGEVIELQLTKELQRTINGMCFVLVTRTLMAVRIERSKESRTPRLLPAELADTKMDDAHCMANGWSRRDYN